MNEALLANNLDIVSAGVPPALTMWDRTKGNVKLVAALGSLPNYLITTNPNVHTLKDFSEKDRIAVPAAGSLAASICSVRDWKPTVHSDHLAE
ncbi:hypothetical protein [Rhizobium laguerreae]|uniref:hypothetical protein n=1 Tax=Rhizobium laguerreae TaxID=1076926 RepID=UPI0014425FCB|nr:hypothetical protein [Rhizobium laguerreae]MBY3280390.1 hypothetical protein [Rhizobium laguerreae]NKM43229.1 hypothetical protein [Rhizobium laguerreae]